VRTTQPNAFVTTLLDNYVRWNPERGKSDEEKAADRTKYKPGDNVLPKLRRREERSEDDERMLAEVQALSLREVGIPSGSITLWARHVIGEDVREVAIRAETPEEAATTDARGAASRQERLPPARFCRREP